MNSRPELKVDFCSYKAAKYAVEHWHYSRRVPVGKHVTCGAWEDGIFIGAVWFSNGANKDIATAYCASRLESCELVRIAMTTHRSEISKIVAIAIRMLKQRCARLRLIVSYADSNHGHHGGIYQAGNWIYVGRSEKLRQWFYRGRWVHSRSVTGGGYQPSIRLVSSDTPWRDLPGKHKYLMPLDAAMRRQIEPL